MSWRVTAVPRNSGLFPRSHPLATTTGSTWLGRDLFIENVSIIVSPFPSNRKNSLSEIKLPFTKSIFLSTLSLATGESNCQSINQISRCPERECLTTFPHPRVNRTFRGKVLGQLVAKTESISPCFKGHHYRESCHFPTVSYGTGTLIILFLTVTTALWSSFIPIYKGRNWSSGRTAHGLRTSKFHTGLPAMSSVPRRQPTSQFPSAIASLCCLLAPVRATQHGGKSCHSRTHAHNLGGVWVTINLLSLLFFFFFWQFIKAFISLLFILSLVSV